MKDRDRLGARTRTWNYRFGQYLKKLREERRLRIEQVEELSIPHEDRISSAYLSRCENGLTDLSLERLSILSKIYRTEIGLLVERREQERELATLPPIDVTDLTGEELRRKGVEFAETGDLKAAFANFRAAEERALLETGEGRAQSVAKARLSMSIALLRMARNRLAREEAESALGLMSPESADRPRAILVIAQCYRYLGNASLAGTLLESLAPKIPFLTAKEQADYHLLLGMVHVSNNEYRRAVICYRNASSLYRQCRDRSGECRGLHNAAIAYGKLEQFDRGLKQALKAVDLARKLDNKFLLAWSLQTVGMLHYQAGDARNSRVNLYQSIELARNGDYHDALFCAYFYLWKIERDEKSRHASSTERVLRSLLPKLDETLEEIVAFQAFLGERCDA